MNPIDLPAALARVVSISWTMESNHGLAASVFSGHAQAQRGQLERWSFTMQFPRMTRAVAQEAMGFFMRLEGNLGTFRMSDPAACQPLGIASGSPVLAAAAPAGSRIVSVSGWQPNVARIMRAGDWVQIGDNFSRVRADVDSNALGSCNLDLWPRLMLAVDAGEPVIVRDAKGIFRFASDAPSWALDANEENKPYQISMTGQQEVLQP